jgi:HK97 family phage portal protein
MKGDNVKQGNPMLTKLKSLLTTKSSSTASLIALHTAGRPHWTPRNFAATTREGFAGNVIGYRCSRMIAEAASSVSLLTYVDGTEAETHPVKSLLATPNPAQTGRDLLEQLYLFLMVAGNAYAERVSLAGEARELYALRPDRMAVVPSKQGWPDSYEYSVNGASQRLPRENVLHLKLFNPADDHYGLSPLEASGRAIDTHNAAGAWNKAMLDNAARPSGALVFAGNEGDLTTEQFERIKAELHETYQGARNAGRPMVLEGGLDWKEMGFSPKEMDFIETRNAAAREIALAFGVPPMLLGIPGDNTFANYAEANRTFWRQTVVPLTTRMSAALARFLGSEEEQLELRPDLDTIDALASDRDAMWTRINAATFLTEAEKRAAVGF